MSVPINAHGYLREVDSLKEESENMSKDITGTYRKKYIRVIGQIWVKNFDKQVYALELSDTRIVSKPPITKMNDAKM